MLNRLRALRSTAARSLRSDRGSTLPEVMVSVIVSAVTMSVIAGSVIAVGSLNNSMVHTSVAASESAYTDIRWGNDVRSAVAIAATSSTSVMFTVPGKSGKCSTSAWGPGAGGKGLVITTVAYPTIGGSACTGAASTPTTETMVEGSDELTITYKNPGGRALTFDAGVATLIQANRPSNVAYDAWESTAVGAVTLRTTAAAGTGWERSILSTRSASTILASGAGYASASVKAVPAGNLIAENYLVDTVAGSGAAGWADGTAGAAIFNGESGIAVDRDDNVYVADTLNNRIRKITANGVVTTIAGTGVDGYVDNLGGAAQFSKPADVAVDDTGTLYVADTGNQLIRRISADGVVTTIAGTPGVAGTVDGAGTAARLNDPSSIAVSAAGVIYFTEATGNTVRQISTGGAVTTLAGSNVPGALDGTGASAQFRAPEGVDVDAAGNVFVADTGNNRIRKVTPAGVVTIFSGGFSAGMVNGPPAVTRFSGPRGVSVDAAGNVFVADTGNWRIRMITPAGQSSVVAGKSLSASTDAIGRTAAFTLPDDIDVSPGASGSIIVADRGGNSIRSLR